MCHDGGNSGVDDYNTTESDNHLCELSYEYNETHITIESNGLPNHDFESGPGCCASAQEHLWTIPLNPTNDTDCTPIISTEGCEMAPERGPVAFTVTGVSIFGPEDGPGGDAVANHEGEYEEDRQEVWLGICHGHSGPGGEYHYHADANCVHWHADEETGETWRDYSIESSREVSEHSKIVGFAFDGYPIYGFVGSDETGVTREITSSYRLKSGENGYNGIDDYEYVQGLGDLDSCNGRWGATPEFPNGTYHYVTTFVNGQGDLGFPYFLMCYRGEAMIENADAGQGGGGGDGEPDCSGHGVTWGPGIGPPPPGCENGPGGGQGQSTDSGIFGTPWFAAPPAGGSGAIILILLAMVVIFERRIKESASGSVARGQADTILEYRPTQARA